MTDARSQKVLKFDAEGKFTLQWGGQGTGNGLFEKPAGITVSADGFVYVSDFDNDIIQKFTRDGRFIRQAQDLGFSLREIKELLSLRLDPASNCADVQERARYRRAQ